MEDWPDDADGGVFRRLEECGFDFSRKHKIDFEVDFDIWPPPEAAVTALESKYPSVTLCRPEDDFPGHVRLEVFDVVTYEFVIRMQEEVTRLVAPFGGRCDSWGVIGRYAVH